MALSVIPLGIKGKIISYGNSNDTTLYAFLFYKYGDTSKMIDGVSAVYTVEAEQIANLSTQIAYGVYINPVIDGESLIFRVKYLGYEYVGFVDSDDTEALSGQKFITFINTEVEDRLLPVPEEGDVGKVPTVQEDLSYELETPITEDARIPQATAEDEGKVLMVNNTGAYVLGEVEGGSVVPDTEITVTNVDVVTVTNNVTPMAAPNVNITVS